MEINTGLRDINGLTILSGDTLATPLTKHHMGRNYAHRGTVGVVEIKDAQVIWLDSPLSQEKASLLERIPPLTS